MSDRVEPKKQSKEEIAEELQEHAQLSDIELSMMVVRLVAQVVHDVPTDPQRMYVVSQALGCVIGNCTKTDPGAMEELLPLIFNDVREVAFKIRDMQVRMGRTP